MNLHRGSLLVKLKSKAIIKGGNVHISIVIDPFVANKVKKYCEDIKENIMVLYIKHFGHFKHFVKLFLHFKINIIMGTCVL